MKKIISLLLVLALSLSLAACSGGSAVDSAITEADKLLESGDYAGALAALEAADEYSRLTAKINATRLAQLQAEKGSIIGSWINLEGTTKLTFAEDFTGTTVSLTSGTEQSLDYEITADGRIHITYPGNLKLSMIQEEGINKLTTETGSTVYVSEADYELFAPEIIELTMDNWAEYFELRECFNLYTNDFGEMQSFSIGYGLFLKEEYIDRLENITDVSFEVEADRALYPVNVDEATGEYTLGESNSSYNWDWHWEGRHGTFSASVWDHRYYNDDPRSDLFEQVAGMVSDSWSTTEGDIRYDCVLENAVLTRIQGTIELNK